jgi:transposase
MISDELKATNDRISGSWLEDSRTFSGMLLVLINQLDHQIQKLEDQIAKNSQNSSKQPSLDFNQPVKRKSSVNMPKRDPGGQRGHKGQGGKLKDNPDNIVFYKLTDCPDCGHDLREVAVKEILRRQVEDIPPIKKVVTEYQTEVKTCPVCVTRWQAGGCTQQHEFEYGKRGIERVEALLEVYGVQLSTGTLNNFNRAASKQLEGFIAGLRTNIKQAPAAYFDETGIRVSDKNPWVHVARSKMYSLFGIYRGREKSAHEAMEVLPGFSGIAHRDAYGLYDDYAKKQDSLCCAQIVRELEFVIERHGQQAWAEPLKKLLLKAYNNLLKSNYGTVCKTRYFRYRNQYRMLVKRGLDMKPVLTRPDTQIKGATKQTKTRNLLMRLYLWEEDILRFLVEPLAESTNNQAERVLRMNKVRAKVSGGFRKLEPTQEFMRIRSLISTAMKQAVCPLQALEMVFTKGNTDYLALINPD